MSCELYSRNPDSSIMHASWSTYSTK